MTGIILVTRQAGHYETGVYDIRTGTPRPTLLASVLKDLAAGRRPAVAGITAAGWWRRDALLIHRGQSPAPDWELDLSAARDGPDQPLLIVSQGGDLAALAVRACELRGLPYVRCTEEKTEAALAAVTPWAVLDVSDRDRVCSAREAVVRARALPPIARLCVANGVRYAVITGAQPWHQADHPEGILELRTKGVFVTWDRWARAGQMLDLLEQHRPLDIDQATPWTGVYGPDLMDVALDFLFDGISGAVDLRNRSGLSELDCPRELVLVAEAPDELIRPQGTPVERSAFA